MREYDNDDVKGTKREHASVSQSQEPPESVASESSFVTYKLEQKKLHHSLVWNKHNNLILLHSSPKRLTKYDADEIV